MTRPSPRIGLILINLGTPDTPTPGAIRRYLKEFLWDPRVVELPRLLWWLILTTAILPLRPRKIAKSYQSIWTEKGSPLRVISNEQVTKLQAELNKRLGPDACQVEIAMTYGLPTLDQAWQSLKSQGVEKLFVLPLYPQYSATTTAAAFDAINRVFAQERNIPAFRFCRDYHQHPLYINALAERISHHWQEQGDSAEHDTHLLFSFHGIPQACTDKGDPYEAQCHSTAKAVAKQLQLKDKQWQVSFQSRVGKATWLQPYTDTTVTALGQQGLTRLDVICPGFAVDCLETIEEIEVENRHYYQRAGGSGYHYIKALNASSTHIALLTELVSTHCRDWLDELDGESRAKR